MFDTAEKIREVYLVRNDTDRVVFFPFTPLIGYVLPRAEYETIIVRGMQRWLKLSLALSVLAFAIEWSLSLDHFIVGYLTLFGMLLIQYLTVRRLSRKMWKLPRFVAFQYYARWIDVKTLRIEAFAGFTMMPLLLLPNVPWFIRLFSLMWAYMFVSSSCLLIMRWRLKQSAARLEESSS